MFSVDLSVGVTRTALKLPLNIYLYRLFQSLPHVNAAVDIVFKTKNNQHDTLCYSSS